MRRLLILIAVTGALFTGTSAKARAAQAAQAAQADSSHRVLVRAADSAFATGARRQAIAGYREVVQRDSTRSSRSVYRLAVLLAEDGVFRESIALHRLYITLEPNDSEGMLGLARTYSWAGRTDDALKLYRAVLTKEPDYRAAALGAGQVLAWAGRFTESVAAYRSWLKQRPQDREAALTLARTLAWWGKLTESARLYDSLRMSDADTEARKGLAIVAAWQGDLARSERIWRELAREAPNDAEIWTGLAQVLRWRGQPFEAREALDRALTLDPNHRDAQSQRRWLDSELAPTVYANVLTLGDSDDNRAQFYRLDAATRPWHLVRLRLDAQQVRAQLAGRERVSETARARLMLRLPWRDGGWNGRVELGANRRAIDGAPVIALGQLALGGRLSQRSSGEIRLGRSVIDETVALINAGIRVTSVEGDWEAQVGDRFNVNASLGRGQVRSDTASNMRLTGAIGARWLMAHGRSFGIAARSIQHEREATDGYFSPRRYVHVELSARARTGRDLGLALSGDAGLGMQHVDYRGSKNTQPTQRLTGTVSYVFTPGLEWTFTGVLANVATAMTSTAGTYRFGSLSVGGRVPLR